MSFRSMFYFRVKTVCTRINQRIVDSRKSRANLYSKTVPDVSLTNIALHLC